MTPRSLRWWFTPHFKSRKAKTAVLALEALVALLVIGTLAGSPAAPRPTANPTPFVQPTVAPPPAPVVIVDVRGEGIRNSQPFAATATWTLAYSFDCSRAGGGTGNFSVSLYQGTELIDLLVNELSAGGSSSTTVYDTGPSVHLEVLSECSWHLVGTEP